jgi:hypothetical protein
VLLDPLATPDEVDGVTEVVLSNRHHKREAFEAAERFGAPVRVPRVGLHEFGDDQRHEGDAGHAERSVHVAVGPSPSRRRCR